MALTGRASLGPANHVPGAVRPPRETLSREVNPALKWMRAERIQWDCDLARQEFSIFLRDGEGADVEEPVMVCSIDEWLDCVVPADRVRLRLKLLSLFESATRSFDLQIRVATPDGHAQVNDVCALVVRDEQGMPLRIVGHQSRRFAHTDTRPSFAPSIYHDPLTGLPNRRLFEQCFVESLERARRDQKPGFAVLFIDLDGFKQVNDRNGHLVGDRTLVAVAERFLHCVRPEDVVARRDGDEFTILLKDISQPAAAVVADRILEHLRAPMSVNGGEVCVTASIGMVLCGAAPSSPEDLLRRADEAMYHAKARGGDCCVTAGHDHRNPQDLHSVG